MPDTIKFLREDLATSATSAGTASTGTEDTRTATAQASDATRTEIDDATLKLQQHFDRIGGEFSGQITRFRTAVEGSDWAGQARETALSTATTFELQLNQLMGQTTTQISDFRTWMIAQADAYNDDVSAGLGGLLTQFGERYDGLSTVITAFTTQMDDIEATGTARFA